MTLRIFIFLSFMFFAVFWLTSVLKLPIDGFLAALLISGLLITTLFAHYRHIGRQRSRGLTQSALRHLSVWKVFLPSETYHQLRLQILVEADSHDQALQELEHAAQKNLLHIAFLKGFRAELERRRGNFKRAKVCLKEGIEETPPGLLLAGLYAQLIRLYIHHLPSQKHWREAELLLDEADGLVDTHIHALLLKAVRGEYLYVMEDYAGAAELLRESLDELLADHPPPPGAKVSFFSQLSHFLQGLFAQLTYSQQDEHQNPFYAELCHTLGKVYLALGERDNALLFLHCGLSLCQQPFIRQPLEETLQHAKG